MNMEVSMNNSVLQTKLTTNIPECPDNYHNNTYFHKHSRICWWNEFTFDVPDNHESGKMPIFDVQIKINEKEMNMRAHIF